MLGPMLRRIVFALALLTLPATARAEDAPTPKAVFPSTSFDGGGVAPGAEVEAQFVVRNEGAGELRILAVKPG